MHLICWCARFTRGFFLVSPGVLTRLTRELLVAGRQLPASIQLTFCCSLAPPISCLLSLLTLPARHFFALLHCSQLAARLWSLIDIEELIPQPKTRRRIRDISNNPRPHEPSIHAAEHIQRKCSRAQCRKVAHSAGGLPARVAPGRIVVEPVQRFPAQVRPSKACAEQEFYGEGPTLSPPAHQEQVQEGGG